MARKRAKKPPPPPAARLHLLTLPREIRDEIYSWVCAPTEATTGALANHVKLPSPIVLRISKQITAEIKKPFWTAVTKALEYGIVYIRLPNDKDPHRRTLYAGWNTSEPKGREGIWIWTNHSSTFSGPQITPKVMDNLQEHLKRIWRDRRVSNQCVSHWQSVQERHVGEFKRLDKALRKLGGCLKKEGVEEAMVDLVLKIRDEARDVFKNYSY